MVRIGGSLTMTIAKTDNDNLSQKLAIRLFAMNQIAINPSRPVKILDCFAGDGVLWHHIQKESTQAIEHIGIDSLSKLGSRYLGDNRRYLRQLPLDEYDLIDLDAYGVPYEQFRILADRQYRGIVVGTFIQCVYGGLPYAMLEEIGYSKRMVKKITKLFFRDGWKKWVTFLGVLGYERVFVFHCANKHYFCCIPSRKMLD